MPNFQKIVNNHDRVTISTSDGDLHVDYYPGRVSQKMALQLGAFADLDETTDTTMLEQSFREINTILIGVIKGWNLEDGDAPFPLDADRMMELPLDLIRDLSRALVTSPNGTER